MASDFSITHQTVIEGGFLKEPWAIATKKVDGVEFFVAQKEDRKFARALGLPVKERNPWQKCDLLTSFKLIRDETVDAMLIDALKAEDPLADYDPTHVVSKGRLKAFNEAKVLQIISITFPAFVSEKGDRFDAHTLRVFSAPKRGIDLTVELTEENFNWMRETVANCASFRTKARKAMDDYGANDLIQLTQPACKWRKRANGRHAIYCRHRNADGVWQFHHDTPPNVADPLLMSSIVKDVEQRVQKYHDDNHVPMPDNEE